MSAAARFLARAEEAGDPSPCRYCGRLVLAGVCCTAAEFLGPILASDRRENVVALLTSHRDHERDLGTHGLGSMQGKAWDYEQRVAHRETERILSLLIEVLS